MQNGIVKTAGQTVKMIMEKLAEKKINIDDLDVNVPVSEIDDDSEKPEIDIDHDDLPGLNINPVTPDKKQDSDDEAVIRDSIIRQGILDESKKAK